MVWHADFRGLVYFLFLPAIRHLDGPKVIIGDNLSSHLSLEVIKLCDANNVRFVLLPPNATHLYQPLDVAIFKPIKREWKKVLDTWKDKHFGTIHKAEFPKLLKKTVENVANMSDNIKSGFRATGIYPYNDQIVLKKIPSLTDEDESTTSIGTNASWTPAFVDILSDYRTQKDTTKKPREKKLILRQEKV